MFLSQVTFEFNYFRKQPSFYITFGIFFLLSFFAMVSENVQIGGSSNVYFNSPHAITQTTLIMSLVGMFLVANFVGTTAVRDINSKMDGIILSSSITKAEYLWGRLLGSYAFCMLVFCAIPLGTFIGSLWPTVDPERLGETQLFPYIWAYLIFAVPNFLFCSVLFYLLAIKTRSLLGMYLGVLGFFILYNIALSMLNEPGFVHIGALIDPFGFSAFSETVNYWTPFERNTQVVPLEGGLLTNRVIWLSVTIILVALAHLLIDIRKPVRTKKEKEPKTKTLPPANFVNHAIDQGAISNWQRFAARTQFEIAQIVKSPPFIVLLAFAFFSLFSITFSPSGGFGTDNWPLSRFMASYVEGAFGLMVLIIITYYSAEIVWRERELGIGDIIESTSIKNTSLYFPKILAIALIIASLTLIGVVFSILYQTAKSYTEYEFLVYFGILSLSFVVPSIMSAILAVFIQILSPNKYVGMLIFVIYIVASLVLSQLGLEHNLWHFGETPNWVYSDINQYGHFLTPLFWYNLYWLGFTALLVVSGYALWRRGAEYGLRHRLALFSYNLGTMGKVVLVAGTLLFVGSGGYIYYNTQVLNDFLTEEQNLDLLEAYERKYKDYQDNPKPKIVDVYAEVDIFPSQRRVLVSGHYIVENKTDKPLSETIVTWQASRHTEFSIRADNAEERSRDDDFGVTFLHFDPAIEPSEQRKIVFELERSNKGFVDSNSDTNVVYNGTFLNNSAIFPHFVYNDGLEIQDRHERRLRDLPELERLPELENNVEHYSSMFSNEADFINFETIVSTHKDQFAISPGYLQKEWVDGDRRYFHYKMDAPMVNFMAYLAGSFARESDSHNGIAIDIYHHPSHTMNLGSMIRSVKDSLDYFGEQFSPYQHRQVRIIEFPRYASFAQSFANTIPYSEDIGFIADLRDENAIDYVYFVTAHEMAHQWWGHQVVPANVHGGQMIAETLSSYSAYMVMEKHLGKDKLRQFLKHEMDDYLRGRSNEVIEEMPLYRVENQGYIHYNKGGVVMYALRDRFGAEAINTGLRNFLEEFQYATSPYPTSLDLIRHLKSQIPEDGHALVDDLVKKITLFDLKISDTKVVELDDGSYDLEITVSSAKFYSDGQGQEEEVSLNEEFDIGLFSTHPDEPDFDNANVIYFEKHRLQAGDNVIKINVNTLPEYVGVDPYITMIDRNSDDNLRSVSF